MAEKPLFMGFLCTHSVHFIDTFDAHLMHIQDTFRTQSAHFSYAFDAHSVQVCDTFDAHSVHDSYMFFQ